jgi:hypothetical protein
MPIRFDITYSRLAAVFRGPKRTFPKLLKEAWRRTAVYWVNELLPLRFKPGAVGRYHMSTKRSVMLDRKGRPRKNRDGSPMTYADWKKRSRKNINPGRDVPLILTGTLKRQVLSPTRQTIKTLPAGRGVKITLRHDARGKYVSENLRKIPEWEKKRLEQYFIATLAELMSGFKGRVRRRSGRRAA